MPLRHEATPWRPADAVVYVIDFLQEWSTRRRNTVLVAVMLPALWSLLRFLPTDRLG
jgi:hypothetical protein